MTGTGPGAGFSLSDGWDLSGLTLTELWLRYLAVGGTATAVQVAAYARGQVRPDSHQHNMVAQAINEYFTDQGENHPVSYQDIPSPPHLAIPRSQLKDGYRSERLLAESDSPNALRQHAPSTTCGDTT